DRLWQMEFSRRIGHGTLSEVLGEATLDTDRFIRTLGWQRTAEIEAQNLEGDAKEALEAYAAGVNAFIESHGDTLPPEFLILGYKPAPWTPVDSLVWGKVMAWNLGDNWEGELLRARLIQALGEEKTWQLTPFYPSDHPLIIPPQVEGYRGWDLASADAGPEAFGQLVGMGGGDGLGSNSWVVDGTMSDTGMPILANDIHLDIQMPSIWYEVHLEGGGFNVVGVSLPGVPGVVAGHNQDIAWGLTYVGTDVQDLYLEKINPDNPQQYEYQGEWQDMEIIEEVIQVKGQEPMVLPVRITRHGPLLSDVAEDISGALGEEQAVAFRWTALDPNRILESLLDLDRAENWAQFHQALSQWAVPGLNVVYADVQGNIGYQMTGLVPIRAPGHSGLLPVPGWTGEYEWQGYVPYEEMPAVYNPPQHFIVAANNRVIGDDYPYPIAFDWDPGFRAKRITDLLSGQDQFSLADFQRMQADDYFLPAATLLPYLLALEPNGFLEERALNQLRGWDMGHAPSSTGALIFETFYLKLVENTVGDELGALLPDYLDSGSWPTLALKEIVADPQNPWYDDVSTAEVETREEIIRRSWEEALDFLGDHFGDAPHAWTWGRLHTATFQHITFGGILPLNLIFDRGPMPVPGSWAVLNNARFDYTEPFVVTSLPSYRQVIDLSNLANSQSMHTTGQSGIPFHPHYADMIDPWERVEYHPMVWDSGDVQGNKEGLLILEPGE
ncbi:MAG: penicillin acylase family protein, partial [Chloroflexi bacterium]|nr:penicillin acylase family protein [Chloroflexota bacterium]